MYILSIDWYVGMYVYTGMLLLFLALVFTSGIKYVAAQESDSDSESAPAPTPTPAPAFPFTTTTPTPPVINTTTPTTTNESAIRARVMVFGLQPDTPDVVAWATAPGANVSGTGGGTGGDIADIVALEPSNNITGDGIGEFFLTLPNTTAKLNQQVEACILDVENQIPVCDTAFQSNVTAATTLQLMLPESEATEAAGS